MQISTPVEQVLQELDVNPATGLTEQEAAARLVQHGPNKLQARQKKTLLQLFLAQLRDALIYVLFAAVAITVFMGEYVDALIILGVIVLNAVLGVVQEVKAGNAIEALQQLASPRALVRRGGQAHEVESEGLVPGDIVLLDAGRLVAADLRLLESANLQIEESALTGESVPTTKDAHATLDDPQTPLGDQANAAFMSTLVTYGRGTGVVVGTGMNTQVGKIAGLLGAQPASKTPLEKRLDELGKTLGKVAVGICVVMFALAALRGHDLASTFLLAVSLAVASIPEGLTAIVAVVLSVGVTAMARHHAIIRKLPAVETLGSVDIVCTDKTGTLTQNKMTVTRYYVPGAGEATVEATGTTGSKDARRLAEALILCSDATYDHGEGTGDPTEIALLVFGDQLGLDRRALAATESRVSERAFDSDRKLMSTLSDNGELRVFTKGAIDSLLPRCTHVHEHGQAVLLTDARRAQVLQAAEAMSEQALRTLAAAYKPVEEVIEPESMEQDLVLLGVVGMIDPPRQEARDAIGRAAAAGITTVMITGDHKNTAFAIARQLGIADAPGQAVTGEEINGFPDAEFAQRVAQYRVFARVSPEHKVKIVRAFQAGGNIVSMTGDGVNDAPSLSAADIGVAMGITGTDVARNAADMILTDDNFATIIAAIEQGRNIYNNIKKSVIFLLASNMGEVVAMVLCILIGLPAPLIATQLLWINLLTDSLPAVALGMDPGDPDVMQERPRNPQESFFAHGAGWQVVLGGALIGLLTMAAFWYGYYEHDYSPYDQAIPAAAHEYARTLAFMTIICSQLLFALSFRSSTKSLFRLGLLSNKYLVGAVALGLGLQLLALTVPPLQKAFKLQMLDARGWLVAIAFGLVPLAMSEVYKAIARARAARQQVG
ncbi:cation-translocating P-type ATPase [Hymenobacter busanensis]|uniref:Cation-translocating P-type ATPase n=1 Tax=Hymenobacter busanensis TaxID=2607656 RepID=A0A7L4ZT49_9BACT|nr:cation-translocating P-type ATPase [Hymenobacter busanensis]KAA9327704.1 cation-translocating P-type ATPase [Hymenobacter busanensis]QHJ05956.1 HAD-IC family P-type ATPase [Hymenobacter busanensis]